MAVIKLKSAIGAKTGTLGLKGGECVKSKLQVVISGYPSDKPEGDCAMTTCMVDYKCSADATPHT
jgi:hypothetical protein